MAYPERTALVCAPFRWVPPKGLRGAAFAVPDFLLDVVPAFVIAKHKANFVRFQWF